MLDLGEVRDPMLAVVEALKECTSTMQRLASVMEATANTQPLTRHRELPPGMTVWVSAADVAQAMSRSPSKGHEYLRAAAGRSVRTGHLLRVPVDV
jgi:hypothetical protein